MAYGWGTLQAFYHSTDNTICSCMNMMWGDVCMAVCITPESVITVKMTSVNKWVQWRHDLICSILINLQNLQCFLEEFFFVSRPEHETDESGLVGKTVTGFKTFWKHAAYVCISVSYREKMQSVHKTNESWKFKRVGSECFYHTRLKPKHDTVHMWGQNNFGKKCSFYSVRME